MGSKSIKFLSFSILLRLVSHLLLNLFQLFSLLSKLQLLFAVKLLFKSDHILFDILKLLPVFISRFNSVCNLCLSLYHLDGFLSQLVSEDTQWTLLYFLLVSIELSISSIKLVFEIFDLRILSLLIMLKLSFLILESLFNIDNFFLLAGKRPAYFSNLVL